MNNAARMTLRVVAIISAGGAAWVTYNALRPWDLEMIGIAEFLALVAIVTSIWSVEEKELR